MRQESSHVFPVIEAEAGRNMCCGREFNTDKGGNFLLNTGSKLFKATTHSPTEILPWNGNPIYLRIKRGEGIASPLLCPSTNGRVPHLQAVQLHNGSLHRPQGFLSPSESGDELRKGPSHRNGLPSPIRGNPLQRSRTSLVGDEL